MHPESACKSKMILQLDFSCLFLRLKSLANDTMQYISDTQIPSIHPNPIKGRGGRISSPKLRKTLEQSQNFCGLESDVNRYDLLLLVKRVGKVAGFSAKMVNLLDYYMAFTRDVDWEEGAQPIVYQSLAKTSLDLGVSERQIQRLEQSLFDAGALTWNDSGNHRRYGQRCPETGGILYAYGVDLTPLAYLKSALVQQLFEKQERDRIWMELKRQVSWYRRQIRSCMSELEQEEQVGAVLAQFNAEYDSIAKPIRTHMGIECLEVFLDQHKVLYDAIVSLLRSDEETKTQKESSKDDTDVINYKSTNKQQSNKLDTGKANAHGFQKSSNEHSESQNPKQQDYNKPQNQEEDGEGDIILKTGLQHITLKQALNVASERFRENMPLDPRPMNWNDFVEASYKLKADLHISQQSWAHACVTLGRTGAAICILLTDYATYRDDNPVAKPAGYFNAMINRAKSGDLKLHSSIFGILKREGDTNIDKMQ